MAFDYFYGKEADKFMFIRIPKLLFELDDLKDLSMGAKVMYGLMLDRVNLSAENHWIDKHGRVYIIYTIKDAMRALGCSKKKAVEIIKELEIKGLIEKVRRGMGKPNLIYVKNFLTEVSEMNLKKYTGHTSTGFQNTPAWVSGSHPNNTNKNNTELNNTDYDPSSSDMQAAMMDERSIYTDIIKDNITLSSLFHSHPGQSAVINELVGLMVDVVCSKEPKIRIGNDDKPQQVVKSMFLKVNQDHITYVLDCLAKNKEKIRNRRAYLLTALYNASVTMHVY